MLAATAIGWCSAARADENEDAPPSRLKPGWLHVDFDQFFLEFESNMQWREVRSSRPRQRDLVQKNRDLRFTESLGFSLRGDIIDPNLISFAGTATVGLNQGQFREQVAGYDHADSDSGFLSEFDFTLDVLPTKPISAHAYARRTDDRVARRFLPSLRERITEAGASILAITGPVTTEIGFSLSDIERTGNNRIEDDEKLRTDRFYVNSAWDIADQHKLKFSFAHEDQENTFQGSTYDFNILRDEFRLEHQLAFGPDNRHQWDAFLRYNQERGTLARDEFEATGRLSLAHTEKFRTVYRYGFYSFDQSAIRVDLHKFDLEALYQPTDNLRFTLDGFAQNESTDQDLETDQYGVGFDVAYRRTTSLGELAANFAMSYDQVRTSGEPGYRLIRGEAHVMEDVRPVYLTESWIDPISIVAHNGMYSRFYVIGVDYTVHMLRGRTIVRRVPTGRIALGEVVYFDYTYQPPARAQIDTTRVDLLIEHTFNFGLTPYYYFESRYQHVEDSIATPLFPDRQSRQRMGLRFRRDRYSLGAELEIFDDTIEPYDALHLTGRWSLIRDGNHTLDVGGELSHYRFEGGVDKRHVWWLDLNLTDRWQLNPYLSLNTAAAYHREDDSVDGITDGVDLEMVLAYTRNYLSVELALEYDLLDINRNSDEGFGMFIRVRRDLSHLIPTKLASR